MNGRARFHRVIILALIAICGFIAGAWGFATGEPIDPYSQFFYGCSRPQSEPVVDDVWWLQ